MKSVHHLRALQALEAAMRLGSLSQAAAEIGVTSAAIGQRVKALEDYIGLDLMARGRSGLRATPELAAALPDLSAAFRSLERACDLLDLQRAQDIHIAAPQDFVDLWLGPRLARFRQDRPNLRFCINGEGDAPYRPGRTDCLISFGPITPASGDTLFKDYLVPVGSPENVARLARTPSRRKLEGFPLLHLDFYGEDPEALNWPQWVAIHRHRRSAPARGMRFRRITAGLDAVRSSAGFMICGTALLQDMLADGALRYPFGAGAGRMTSYAFQARFRDDPRPQFRAFRKWILDEAALTARWLAGDGRFRRGKRRPAGGT